MTVLQAYKYSEIIVKEDYCERREKLGASPKQYLIWHSVLLGICGHSSFGHLNLSSFAASFND